MTNHVYRDLSDSIAKDIGDKVYGGHYQPGYKAKAITDVALADLGVTDAVSNGDSPKENLYKFGSYDKALLTLAANLSSHDFVAWGLTSLESLDIAEVVIESLGVTVDDFPDKSPSRFSEAEEGPSSTVDDDILDTVSMLANNGLEISALAVANYLNEEEDPNPDLESHVSFYLKSLADKGVIEADSTVFPDEGGIGSSPSPAYQVIDREFFEPSE